MSRANIGALLGGGRYTLTTLDVDCIFHQFSVVVYIVDHPRTEVGLPPISEPCGCAVADKAHLVDVFFFRLLVV